MGNRYSIWHEMNVHGTYLNITATNLNFNDIVSSQFSTGLPIIRTIPSDYSELRRR